MNYLQIFKNQAIAGITTCGKEKQISSAGSVFPVSNSASPNFTFWLPNRMKRWWVMIQIWTRKKVVSSIFKPSFSFLNNICHKIIQNSKVVTPQSPKQYFLALNVFTVLPIHSYKAACSSHHLHCLLCSSKHNEDYSICTQCV